MNIFQFGGLFLTTVFGVASLGFFAYGAASGRDGSGYIVGGVTFLMAFINSFRAYRQRASNNSIVKVKTEEALDEACRADKALIYKHSYSCPIARTAFDQVTKFAMSSPDIRIYLIDVVQHRSLSGHAAKRLGIHHESPQAIAITDGKPTWNASHYDITAQSLAATFN